MLIEYRVYGSRVALAAVIGLLHLCYVNALLMFMLNAVLW